MYQMSYLIQQHWDLSVKCWSILDTGVFCSRLIACYQSATKNIKKLLILEEATQMTDLIGSKVTLVYFTLSRFSHFGKLNGKSSRSRSRRSRRRSRSRSRGRRKRKVNSIEGATRRSPIVATNTLRTIQSSLSGTNLLIFNLLPVSSRKKVQPIKSCLLKPGFLRCISGETSQDRS